MVQQYIANPSDGRQVSCDFTVEKDGAIYQLNPDIKKFGTFHAGRNTAFKGLRNGQVTHATIGIEIVQSQKKVEYPAVAARAARHRRRRRQPIRFCRSSPSARLW